MKVGIIPWVLLLGLAACSRAPSSGDPIANFETSCIHAQLMSGNTEGANRCMDLADRMRARRAVTAARYAQQAPPAQVTLAQPLQSSGSSITGAEIEDGKIVTVSLIGPITNGDTGRFQSEMNSLLAKYPAAVVGIVILNSPGGSVVEAAKMAQLISGAGLYVAVPDNAECSSACFMLFASGKRKLASPTSRIGVHSAIDSISGIEITNSKATTMEIARVCNRLGVPSEIIGRMITTPPGQVAWLTSRELKSMDVVIKSVGG